MTKPNIGDVILVKVGGKEYKTVIDAQGNQRFNIDPLLEKISRSEDLRLMNWAALAYQTDELSKDEYLELMLRVGWTVNTFESVVINQAEGFEDLEIVNPLWVD